MDYRTRRHQAAHLDETPQEEVPELELVHRGEPKIVASAQDLAPLLETLRADGVFAYDTEFIGEQSYFPKLCLVQVASRSTLALIDPLGVGGRALDLMPFWELVADPAVTKIVHAAESDVEPVARHLGRAPANVFDTQIAAAFIALAYPISLKKLVLELTGASLGKDAGFTDWQQRPLTPMQVRYAADDVRYLPATHREMASRLNALGRLSWVEEECAATWTLERLRSDPTTQYARVRGVRALHPRAQAVLKELAIWRDATARGLDKPPRSFLKDEVLIDLAKDRPRSAADVGKVRSLPKRVADELGAEIAATIARGWALPQEHWPVPEAEPDAAERYRYDAAYAVFLSLCSAALMDPGMVANRKELEDLLEHVTEGDEQPPALLRGWRGEAIGQTLYAFLQGRSGITLSWKDGVLEVTPAEATRAESPPA
jgi:ribonuclease D